jgi:hypothetical protein
MSYSDPRPYCISAYHDFGAGGEAMTFRGPKGKQGTIKEINVDSFELFTNTTTEAFIRLGSATSGYEYVNMGLGTLADAANAQLTAVDADLVLEALPADTDVHLTLVAPTGGTPGGKAHYHIMIEWY